MKGSHAVVWSGSRGACSSGCSRRRPSGASRRTISNGPENIAERELGRRQLTEDGNVEISEREVRRVSVRTPPTERSVSNSTLCGPSAPTDEIQRSLQALTSRIGGLCELVLKEAGAGRHNMEVDECGSEKGCFPHCHPGSWLWSPKSQRRGLRLPRRLWLPFLGR